MATVLVKRRHVDFYWLDGSLMGVNANKADGLRQMK